MFTALTPGKLSARAASAIEKIENHMVQHICSAPKGSAKFTVQESQKWNLGVVLQLVFIFTPARY